VKDVVTSHDTLIHLFERIHFFLQRLKSYTGMPLTHESRELLGKILAQLLSVLALSTKAMTDRRISELIRSLCLSLADYGSEKFLKKLVGRNDVDDALLRLDMLTKEESLMLMARNLEVTHQINGVVHDVDDNVKVTKLLAEDIDDNVQATKVLTEDIDDNVKTTKVLTEDIDDNIKATKVLVKDHVKGIEGVARSVDNGTQHFLSVFMHTPTLFCIST
jgi:hypothetical protein